MDIARRADGGEAVLRDARQFPQVVIELQFGNAHRDRIDLYPAPEAFALALVRVSDGFAHQPVYVRRFFDRQLSFAETAVVFNIKELISLGGQA